MKDRLAAACRLVLITDGRGDARRVQAIAAAAVAAGVRAVQVREPSMPARQLAELCERLRPLLDQARGLLLVNDRADVAAAAAHGVHLGHRSLAPAAARAVVGERAVVGFSAHRAEDVAWAAAQGADYASLSPVFPTTSKPGAPTLGADRAAAIAAAAPLPVVWLGGFDAARVAEVAGRRPFGIAVMSAICSAAEPGEAAAALLARLESSCASQ